MFEHSFDGLAAGRAAPPERKPVTLKPEQYDALKQESYDAGFGAGRQAGLDHQAAQVSALFTEVRGRLDLLLQEGPERQRQYEAFVREVAAAAVRKILPSFAAKQGMDEINALLAEAIGEMLNEPRLVVRVNEGEFDAVNAAVEKITAQAAYAGKVVLLADPEVASGDCRIEWADGGMERNTATTLDSIERLINPRA
jgi:flagellar assembly protein FliH